MRPHRLCPPLWLHTLSVLLTIVLAAADSTPQPKPESSHHHASHHKEASHHHHLSSQQHHATLKLTGADKVDNSRGQHASPYHHKANAHQQAGTDHKAVVDLHQGSVKHDKSQKQPHLNTHQLENLHKATHKRSFGSPMRVWTPSQGPTRRSASSAGRHLEPFEEDSFPGWSTRKVYDIPRWDGGDRAACPSQTASGSSHSALLTQNDADEKSATRHKRHKRRKPIGVAGEYRATFDFCLHGNTPITTPDESSCEKHQSGKNKAKRLITDFSQINQIVDAGFAIGNAARVARSGPDAGGGGTVSAVGTEAGRVAPSGLGLIPSVDQITHIVQEGVQAGQAEHAARQRAGLVRPSTGSLARHLAGPGLIPPLARREVPALGKAARSAEPQIPQRQDRPVRDPVRRASDQILAWLETTGHKANNFIRNHSRRSDTFGSSDPSPAEVFSLVKAGLETDDELKEGKSKQVIKKRSPLGPAMALGGMGGAGGGMQILEQMMPLILAGIQAFGKLGTAWLNYQTVLAEKNHTKQDNEPDSSKTAITGQSAAGNVDALAGSKTSGSGTSGFDDSNSADKTKRSTSRYEFDPDTSVTSAQSSTCGGSTSLCIDLIQHAFPYCHLLSGTPLTSSMAAEGKAQYGDAATKFVRIMATHCSLKCDGFSEQAELKPDLKKNVETCVGNGWKWNAIHNTTSTQHVFIKPSVTDAATKIPKESTKEFASDFNENGHLTSSKRKRDLSSTLTRSPKATSTCKIGYTTLFTNAMRPVVSYSNKNFGSVISDPAHFLHWGLVESVAQCLKACDDTQGCIFANIYQQTFNLDNPTIHLVNRRATRDNGGDKDAVGEEKSHSKHEEKKKGDDEAKYEFTGIQIGVKDGSIRSESEIDGENESKKKAFATKPETKKSSFVQGKLTCALYSKCHLECDANHASGEGDPIFFEHSAGYCKSKDCVKAGSF
ncbi:uncharacterized protein MEPE_00115 [Melanopsichium pennsylvanicum]|uniref:Apple domain-containing protein n=2 Tax=Melanopsichium pennsylvanicum TaxID=63383 RepID=A0AAJ4XFB2_9BASI|nr:hypothetical protein BN887_02114 [Melanopsichium pennsylvanicum 4]SNX81410.1 uncharacterized protein MEPE_00115 [Melanopsichium pennsylvanicum]